MLDHNTIAIVLLLVYAVALFGLVGPLLLPFFKGGAPFVTSSSSRVKELLKAAHLTSADRVADLGSGDGRIVRAAARAGAREAVGYEIQPALVLWSRLFSLNVPNARFVLGSFWKADLKSTNVVFLYQLPGVMEHLIPKLLAELPPGARVISNDFKIRGWKPASVEGHILTYDVDEQRKNQSL